MMTLRQFMIALALGAFALGTALPALAQASKGSSLAARSSDAAGVRVVVKPTSIAAGSAWEFEVTMDTHTKPLNEDLTKSSVLVDDSKARYAPLAWQGDAPGGHHRKGVLRFPAPAAPTKSFELQIEGVGAAGIRVFQWRTD
jgi:hypothetical protein